jgi:hypothetical protein
VAQSLWVDVHRKVTWRLAGLTKEQLSLLFDGRKLLKFWQDLYRFDKHVMGSITAWNPRISYEFLDTLGITRSTQIDTIYALTDWIRGHVVHILSDEENMQLYGYAGFAPTDKIIYALDGRPHVVEGCWGVSGLYGAMLRAVNIPVEPKYIRLSEILHSRPFFPTVDQGLAHGDDANAYFIPTGFVVPPSQKFFNQADLQILFIAPEVDCAGDTCNSPSKQASYNHSRIFLGRAYDNMTDDLLYKYSKRGSLFLHDLLRGPLAADGSLEFIKPFFTETERANMLEAVGNRISQIGNGNLQAGKAIVIDRVEFFGENK